ncbi:FkbM family methyltransferase [Roseovarius aestuariivivens]|uniref:FkbM family methyltransferase n=1 Tax=Roseovarius aestuariivivens TaxID=1888910 RepID=UPI00108130E6|nr:FkbM family methyltransferase [Roseovarius aestuariivivens]
MKTFLIRLLRLLLTTVKPKSGLAKFATNEVVRNAIRALPTPLVARLPGGLEIEVDPEDFNGRKLWLSGTNDWKITNTVIDLLDRDDILLDIGANYGSVGLAAREKVGTQGHVHLFEPQPDLVRRMRATLDTAGADNVSLHEIALSDHDAEVELVLKGRHSGGASIVAHDAAGKTETIRVEARKTRDFVAPLVGDKAFGVKIDVEGAEPLILPDLLGFPTLKFVIFEGNQNVATLFDLLESHEFAIFGFCRTVLRTRVARVADAQDRHRYHDFVAIRRDQAEGLVKRIH